MSSRWDLKPYLWTLNAFCLFCFHCTIKGVKIKTIYIRQSDKIRSFIALCISQIICTGMLFYFIFNSRDFQIKAYNRTGNTYLSLNYIFCCVLIAITYIYFYINQNCFVKIFKVIFKFQSIYSEQSCYGHVTIRQLYFLYIFLVISNTLNYYKGLRSSQVKTGVNICYNIMLSVTFIISGIIMTMYMCFIKIMTVCLKELNKEIFKVANKITFQSGSVRELYGLIMKRKLIIDLCQYELSNQFGIIQMPITAYVIFYIPSGPFFLISVIYKINFDNIFLMLSWCFTTLYWVVPWLVMFIMMMSSNDIQNEVST